MCNCCILKPQLAGLGNPCSVYCLLPFPPSHTLFVFLPFVLFYVHNCLILSADFFQGKQWCWSGHQISLNWGNNLAHTDLFLSSLQSLPPLQMLSRSFKGKAALFQISPAKPTLAQLSSERKWVLTWWMIKSCVLGMAVLLGGQAKGMGQLLSLLAFCCRWGLGLLSYEPHSCWIWRGSNSWQKESWVFRRYQWCWSSTVNILLQFVCLDAAWTLTSLFAFVICSCYLGIYLGIRECMHMS